MAKKKKSKKNNNANILILVLLLVLIFGVASAIIYPQITSSGTINSNTKQINLPTVVSNVKSVDGEYHSIQTKFTLAFDKQGTSKIDSALLHAQVEEIMSTIDYDKMMDQDSTDYVKEYVWEGLAQYIDTSKLKDIYITGMLRDNSPFEPSGNFDDSRQDGVYRGLFNN